MELIHKHGTYIENKTVQHVFDMSGREESTDKHRQVPPKAWGYKPGPQVMHGFAHRVPHAVQACVVTSEVCQWRCPGLWK